MRTWLLEPRTAEELRVLLRDKGLPNADALKNFRETRGKEARCTAQANGRLPDCLTIAGNVAQINVVGVLTEEPDFWIWWLYGENTSYAEIRESLAIIANDPTVQRVEMHVCSPGGELLGLFEAFAALEAFTKKIDVKTSYAASAAYGLAAVAGKIEAKTRVTQVGSVGVVMGFYVFDFYKEVTSTAAPEKRPDVTTEEGVAAVRRSLDPLHNEFASAIARNRTRHTGEEFTVETVNETFGRGNMVIAAEAKKLGMIDKSPAQGVAATVRAQEESSEPAPAQQPEAAAQCGAQENIMTPEELKAKHPGTYNLIFNEGKAAGEQGATEASKKAVDVALTEERDRVDAHLTAGEASGDMKTATESIRSGAKMTQKLMATYMMAGRNRVEQNNRAADDAAPAAALPNAKPTGNGGPSSGAAAVADELAKLRSGDSDEE